MLEKLLPEHVLFIDIETVPQYENLASVPENLQKLWTKKAGQIGKEGETADGLYNRAGIYAEFGKIVCISAGKIFRKGRDRAYRVKSYSGDDEKVILQEFSEMLKGFMANPMHKLCAHNGQEFDFPFIARRMLINGLALPPILDIAGAKPWEIKDVMLDTLQLWKFGDYKHYTSLELLCNIFNIPTPKDDIDGSQVADIYYKTFDIQRIARYCEKDTFAIAQLILRFKGEPLISQENYEIAGLEE
ncbi:MAG: ribonuclease H-like domain-containing protein [Bacteroidia bacterium]|nr:ribonuclease H-like domain-containing protein [Bacteroidia bacterium]